MLFAALFTDKPGHALRQGVEVLHWTKALDRKVPV